MTLVRLVIALVLLNAGLASAEVSDKIPSISVMWIQGFAIAGAILSLSFMRRWAGLLLLPVTAVFLLGTIDMLSDPHIGPAILQEQGPQYARSAYASSGMMVIAHVAGWLIGRPRRPNHVPGDAA